MKCELCSYGEAIGYFIVKDSHILEDRITKMHLCSLCIKDLKRVGVRLKPIERIKPD